MVILMLTKKILLIILKTFIKDDIINIGKRLPESLTFII